jgi:hypothetical protein
LAFVELCPRTDKRAEEAVELHRSKGGVSRHGKEAAWDAVELAVAVEARVRPALRLIERFIAGSQAVSRALWTTSEPPDVPSGLVKMLHSVPDRFNEWKDSVARQACKFSLDIFLSWHRGCPLEKYARRRKLQPGEEPEFTEEQVMERAVGMAQYVDVDTFLAPPGSGGEAASSAGVAAASSAGSSSAGPSSGDEDDDEDEESSGSSSHGDGEDSDFEPKK